MAPALPLPPSTGNSAQLRHLFFPAAVLALVSQLAIVWAVLAGRAPASSRRPIARWAEIAWVVLPTLVLIAVVLATWTLLAGTVSVGHAPGIQA